MSSHRYSVCVGVLAAVVPAVCWAQFNGPTRTAVNVAAELVPQIAAELAAEGQRRDRVCEVAVLAFGDEEQRISEKFFFTAKVLQGELIAQLRNRAHRQFIVWDARRFKKKVERTGADVSRLSMEDREATAAELRKLGLDAVVVGSRQQPGNFLEKVHADVLFVKGAPLQVSAAGAPEQRMHHRSMESTRFSVDVVVDGQPLPLLAEAFGGADRIRGANRFYLDLNRQRHYGKAFTIRLQNHGMPPVGWITKSRDQEFYRYFCAAVTVDGVNSIYERDDAGEFYPSQRHPSKLTKWVLSAPGTKALRGYTTAIPVYQDVHPPGGSVVNIQGFQLNGETAAQFEFADAGESFSHELGLSKDVGMISIWFYSEKHDTDDIYFPPGTAGAAPGTRQGPTVEQPVFNIRVETHQEPVEVWEIFYRYRDSNDSIDRRRERGEKIVPIAQVQRDMKRTFQEHGDPFKARREAERFRPGNPFPFVNNQPGVGNPGVGRRLGVNFRKCRKGIHLNSVDQGSPATRCRNTQNGRPVKLEAGDHIIRVNGVPPRSFTHFKQLIQNSPENVRLLIIDHRSGHQLSLTTSL